MANSRERLSLVSLRYNNVPSPEAIKHILQGNRAGAYFEIAYGSNPVRSGADRKVADGIARRRVEEATALIGDPKTWTDDEKSQWRDIYQRNQARIDAYDRAYGKWFPKGRRMRDLAKDAGLALEKLPDDNRHTIEAGDTPDSLANKFGVGADAILKAAGTTDPAKLPAGITITVPEPAPDPAGKAPASPAPPASDDRSDASPAASPAARQAAAVPEVSPERAALLKSMEQLVDPAEHTVLKHPNQTTRAEIDDVINHPGYWPGDGDPRSDAFQNVVRGHFETFYERGATRTPPEKARKLKAIGGIDLGVARKTVADALAPAAMRDAIEPAVKGLQRGLNDIRITRGRILPPLGEDGDLGPRTLARIDEELALDGPAWLIDTLRQEHFA